MTRPLLPIALLVATALGLTAQNTTLTGTIIAPTGDSVFVQHTHMVEKKRVVDILGRASLDAQGRFAMKLDLKEPMGVMFYDGNESTGMFLVPGDAIDLTLHTAFFDETLGFTGKGAERNNALAGIALADEMAWNNYYTQVETDDTTAIFTDIAKRTAQLATTIDGYAKAYPEMAAHLATMKEDKAKSADWQRNNAVEQATFKKLAVAMVGKPLTDIIGTGLNGEKVSLSQFKGKTTVVDFWATWCGPCKSEIPHWAELEAQYGKVINFVSVSVWDNEEKWKAMATELKQTHTMFVPKEGIDQLKPYRVTSIPRYMVIDKDLNILTIDAPRPSTDKLQKYF
jgi:thiol-disulfide isomerase/thioredoxin